VDVGVTVSGFTLSANMLGAQYQWVNCNNNFQPIAGATQANFTPTSSGSYAVIVSANGCEDTSNCNFINTVGLDELEAESIVTVFPNPSNGSFYIGLNQNSNQKSIRVINELGVLVFEKNLLGDELNYINLNQPAGVYFFELIDENAHRTVHRIVIQE
jgi:hypothetical protein